MWIRKGLRDVKKGVDSPMPTQVVSNEEFIPRPQTEPQKRVEHLIGEMAAEKSKKWGWTGGAYGSSGSSRLPSFFSKFSQTSGGRSRNRTRHNGSSEGESLSSTLAHFTNARCCPFVMEFMKNWAQSENVSSSSYRLRQGDVLRQRDFDGRDLRRSTREATRPGEDSGQSPNPIAESAGC